MNITPEGGIPLIPLIQDASHRIITVFLTPYNSGEIRNFRCTNCGNIIFQYESEIGMVADTNVKPDNSNPIINKCKRCKLKYIIVW